MKDFFALFGCFVLGLMVMMFAWALAFNGMIADYAKRESKVFYDNKVYRVMEITE